MTSDPEDPEQAAEDRASGRGVPSRAQVVIVGGGVTGCSIAYHLAHLGWTDVVLLEQHQLTAGTTWHAAGLITSAGMTDETALFFSRYSRDLYARLEQETGHSTGFRPVGHISLVTSPRRQEALRREAAWMHGFGVEDVEISPGELAVREAAGLLDMSLMAKLIVQGPDAAAVLSRLSANDVTAGIGRLVYTQWLNEAGGIVADVTVTWLEPEKFLVIASDLIHRRIEPLIRRATRAGEFVTVTDVTSGTTLLSVQGPASRRLIGRLTDADLSNEAFPYLSARQIHVGYAPVLALRVTYVGELGWELHVPAEYAMGVYDDLMAAGTDLGFRLVGLSAMSSLRLEKGYRDMGVDIDNTDNPLQAGLGFAVAWDKPGGFTGRDALLLAREQGPPRHRVVSLLAEDPAADLFGNEPVFLGDEWVGYVRAAAYGYTVGGAVYLHDNLGTSAGLAAAGFAAFSVTMAAGRLAGDRLAAAFGPVRLLRAGGLVAAAGLAGALIIGQPGWAIAGFAVLGAGLSGMAPQIFLAGGQADPARPGHGLAAVVGVSYLGMVGGPALIGGVASLVGLPLALGIPVVLALCVAALAWVVAVPASPARQQAAGAAR